MTTLNNPTHPFIRDGFLRTKPASKPSILLDVVAASMNLATSMAGGLMWWVGSSANYDVGHGDGCRCEACRANRQLDHAW